ncbi:MAG: hypothetical protein JWP01_4211 [Myxococcales bacterium]|nr:hypothetical protein [Myxococcales bacterium]
MRWAGCTAGAGTPTQVNNLIASKVSTGSSHTCAVGKLNAADAQSSVFCWGGNRFGEVGNGARFRDTPVPVTLP